MKTLLKVSALTSALLLTATTAWAGNGAQRNATPHMMLSGNGEQVMVNAMLGNGVGVHQRWQRTDLCEGKNAQQLLPDLSADKAQSVVSTIKQNACNMPTKGYWRWSDQRPGFGFKGHRHHGGMMNGAGHMGPKGAMGPGMMQGLGFHGKGQRQQMPDRMTDHLAYMIKNGQLTDEQIATLKAALNEQ